MRILLIRHGQSRGNIDAIIQGDDDPLTDAGRNQARQLADWLAAHEQITHIYASSLARARETAETIGAALGITPALVPNLAEINAGIAAGMPWADWRVANPHLAGKWQWAKREMDDGWEGGENGRTFSARVFAAFDTIVDCHQGTDDVVAIVSHGGVLSWITARLHGDPIDRWPAAHAGFGNCSISELTYDAAGVHTFGRWNLTDHIVDVPPSGELQDNT